MLPFEARSAEHAGIHVSSDRRGEAVLSKTGQDAKVPSPPLLTVLKTNPKNRNEGEETQSDVWHPTSAKLAEVSPLGAPSFRSTYMTKA